MAETKTSSSFDGEHHPTSAADDKDDGGGVGDTDERAPTLGGQVGTTSSVPNGPH